MWRKRSIDESDSSCSNWTLDCAASKPSEPEDEPEGESEDESEEESEDESEHKTESEFEDESEDESGCNPNAKLMSALLMLTTSSFISLHRASTLVG